MVSRLITRNYLLRITYYVFSFSLLLAGIGGAFLPWIWRASVALQLTGPGLAEFVKFLPAVRAGQVRPERLFFLLPLWVALLTLPVAVENKKLALPGWLRWSLRFMVIPLALAGLSPVWAPAILLAPEFRLQTILAAVAVGLTVIAPVFNRLPLKIFVMILVGSSLAALVLPVWQFNLVQPDMVEAYHEPVSLGWGWWLTAVGLVMSSGGGIYAAFGDKSIPTHSPN